MRQCPCYYLRLCALPCRDIRLIRLLLSLSPPYCQSLNPMCGRGLVRQLLLSVTPAQVRQSSARYSIQLEPYTLILRLPPLQKTTFLRSEEHTSELQSRGQLVCRHLLE